MEWGRYFVVWILVPFGNFLLWNYVGYNYSTDSFTSTPPLQIECSTSHVSLNSQPMESGPLQLNYSYCQRYQNLQLKSVPTQLILDEDDKEIQFLDSESFESYKGNEFARVKSPVPTVAVISSEQTKPCDSYVNIASSMKLNVKSCVGIAWAKGQQSTPYLQRFNSDAKKTGRSLNKVTPRTSGMFRHVAKKRGRISLSQKFSPLLQHLSSVERTWTQLLDARGIQPGDDLTLMVVNDGEIDLFLNFACSCRAHGIPLHNVMVICASAEIVAMVRATGAIGFFHPWFARVNKEASSGYLDKTFVEMMWYKAFSVWIGLKLGYHILFQDVDLVWFKNPFEYFHHHQNATKDLNNGMEYTAYLSDDGQRSLRYTPFYANSGFYYLLSTPKNIYLAYSVVIAFDSLQATGSHQNVFTSRLMETMDLIESHQLFLNLEDFPSGVKYHHDKPFMTRVVNKKWIPYIFHMCWTANKQQKLENFATVKMWYVKDTCPVSSLVPPTGQVFRQVVNKIGSGSGPNYLEKLSPKDTFTIFNSLSSQCCQFKDVL